MLQGKTALITGSTSGIGLQIAEKLAGQKAHIILNGFGKPDEIEAIRIRMEKEHKVKVSYFGADLTNPDEIEGMANQIDAENGGVDILVNNAGIQFVSPIEDFPTEKWNAIIALNLSSSFHTMKHCVPQMKKKNWGRIINIASTHGLVASPNKTAYVAAKHGLVGLTKAVALEVAEYYITCNAICPGFVMTPLVKKQIEDKAKNEGIDVEKATADFVSEKHPSLRFVETEHIAEFVLFLCSEAGSSITGSGLPIDGGWTSR
jgi:3-hydroxybutyrate dehydrogenase